MKYILVVTVLTTMLVCAAIMPASANGTSYYAPNSPADVDDTYTNCDAPDSNGGSEAVMYLFCRPGVRQFSPVIRFDNLPAISSGDVVQAKL